jgi:hypothetical protein
VKNIILSILFLSITLQIFGLFNQKSAFASPSVAFDRIGVVVGSYHFNNDGSHAWRTPTAHYEEYNPGITAFFNVKGIPLINQAGISYITKNSFGTPSIYVSVYHKLASIGPVQIDLAAALATGYRNEVRLANQFDGILPLASVSLIVLRHLEIDIIPAGYIAGNDTANELFFTVRL